MPKSLNVTEVVWALGSGCCNQRFLHTCLERGKKRKLENQETWRRFSAERH